MGTRKYEISEADKQRIIKTAAYVVDLMKGQGVIVQRYDALSTLSIYLKFDYGIANTLRISDHRGKDKLSYKYNIRTDVNEFYQVGEGATEMNFYPFDQVDACLKKILLARYGKIAQYGWRSYERLMNKTVDKMAESKNRFWKSATHV
jgi:hypothetical protein